MAFKNVARDYWQPGKLEEALPLLREMVECSRKEPGCISYELCELVGEADATAMIETWADEEAMKAHMNSEHFQRIFPQLIKLSAQPARVETYNVII